jgi:hypothetical protein
MPTAGFKHSRDRTANKKPSVWRAFLPSVCGPPLWQPGNLPCPLRRGGGILLGHCGDNHHRDNGISGRTASMPDRVSGSGGVPSGNRSRVPGVACRRSAGRHHLDLAPGPCPGSLNGLPRSVVGRVLRLEMMADMPGAISRPKCQCSLVKGCKSAGVISRGSQARFQRPDNADYGACFGWHGLEFVCF